MKPIHFNLLLSVAGSFFLVAVLHYTGALSYITKFLLLAFNTICSILYAWVLTIEVLTFVFNLFYSCLICLYDFGLSILKTLLIGAFVILSKLPVVNLINWEVLVEALQTHAPASPVSISPPASLQDIENMFMNTGCALSSRSRGPPSNFNVSVNDALNRLSGRLSGSYMRSIHTGVVSTANFIINGIRPAEELSILDLKEELIQQNVAAPITAVVMSLIHFYSSDSNSRDKSFEVVKDVSCNENSEKTEDTQKTSLKNSISEIFSRNGVDHLELVDRSTGEKTIFDTATLDERPAKNQQWITNSGSGLRVADPSADRAEEVPRGIKHTSELYQKDRDLNQDGYRKGLQDASNLVSSQFISILGENKGKKLVDLCRDMPVNDFSRVNRRVFKQYDPSTYKSTYDKMLFTITQSNDVYNTIMKMKVEKNAITSTSIAEALKSDRSHVNTREDGVFEKTKFLMNAMSILSKI